VLGEQQAHDEAYDLARREVLSRGFVGGLREFADQFFEDKAHLDVADPVGVQVNGCEPLEHEEEEWAAAGISDSGINGFFYAAKAGC
jgi:hypothetical protein